MSKGVNKSTVVMVNMFLAFVILMTSLFYVGLFTDLGADEGTMRGAVFLAVALFSDVGLMGIFIGMIILGKHTPVSLWNKLLPLITIPALTIPSIKEIYEPITGVTMTDPMVGWLGLGAGAVLLTLTLLEVAKGWKAAKEEENAASS